MIVCKIISNFQSGQGTFGDLYKKLSQIGNILYIQNALYFGSTTPNCTEQKLKTVLRTCGYKNFFINVYTKDNLPHEDDFINGWILDQIMKVNVELYTQESQREFKRITQALDKIEAMAHEVLDNSEEGAIDGGQN